MEMAVVNESDRASLRPGERREPVVVALGSADGELFTSECVATRVAPERAYPLLLERRLLLDDATASGFDGAEAAAALNAAALEARVEVALDAPSSAYLRSLARPAATVVAAKFLASVPVRLYPRAVTVAPRTAIEQGAVREAVAWERASVAAGRTMAEWGFLVLIRSAIRG